MSSLSTLHLQPRSPISPLHNLDRRSTFTDYYICNATNIKAAPDYSLPTCPPNRFAYSYVKCLDWEWFLHPRPVEEVPYNGTRHCREMCEELVKGRFAGRWITCLERECTDNMEVEAMENNGGFMREMLRHYSTVCREFGLPTMYTEEEEAALQAGEREWEEEKRREAAAPPASQSGTELVRMDGWKGRMMLFGLVVGSMALSV
ncbi:hypothetical protein BJ508DRAFT_415178 [Ascobolus immersus RN42]|uniref:Uncharacterized protein n=1 Tax=Ascobolus immersus RN42 TaxID=1160509 RepID=A0A3N4I3K4_ASCIM|nr:hypothetical protein BJ508DRAFT_415178 [Ascobolus immersus RN42]